MDRVGKAVRNLGELIRHPAQARIEAGYLYLSDLGERAERAEQATRQTVSQLARRAEAYCAGFQQLGTQPGDRVLVLAPAAEAALPCLLGAILAGCVPASMLPPMTAADIDAYPERVRRAVHASGARAVVGPSKLLRLVSDAVAGGARSTRVECAAMETLSETESAGVPVSRDPWDDALLLLDFDASSEPTVRTLRHADVLASLEAACVSLALSERDILVCWLPLSHEGGVLAALLPLYRGTSSAFLPTAQFLKKPASWLRAIARVRGTVSYAPGQAYDVCVQRVPEAEDAGIDLSSWRCAAAVDQPPTPAAAARFERRFAPAGFRASLATADLLRPFVRDLEAPLSHGQLAIWYLAQLAPDSLAYNVNYCMRICSEYDPHALCAALAAIVARHPALRTVFGARAGVPYREVLERASAAVEVIDASAWSGAELSERITRDAERRFDLERGPLFVTRLYTRARSDALLLFTAHHIVVDFWSVFLIMAELATTYRQTADGKSLAPEVPATATYDAFVRWQAQLLAGPERARLRSYWERQLADAPAALALPTDRARPAVQSYRGGAIAVELPSALVDELRAVGQRHQATLYAVLLAVFQSLMHRVSGQSDIVIATPSAGRSETAFADVVGCFMNTLPIRVRIDDPQFDAILARTRATTLEALDHQDLPFTNIVDLAQVGRDASRAPLCQVMFQLHAYRLSDEIVNLLQGGWVAGRRMDFGGMTTEPYELEHRVAQFELALDLMHFGGSVTGRLEYNTDLFDEATVRRWAEQFIELARAVVRSPSASIRAHRLEGLDTRADDDSSLLPVEQRELVLERWNATRVAYPSGRVHRAIEQQAAHHPDRVALSAGEHALSYGELNRRANRLARKLRDAGAGPDVLVGVCMDRSIELVTVLLAVMKSGAAYVPLDPTYPADRLRFMIDDARPAVIIGDAPYLTLLKPSSATVWSSVDALALASSPTIASEDLTHEVSEENLAYMIYTSGSTGLPKGVGNTHGGLWNRLMWMQEYLALRADDRVLQKTPYSFDVSVWELFWPLMIGARMVIAAPKGHTDSRYLADEIALRGVTTIHFVPSMLDAFLMEPDLERCACLERIVCSGEALPYAVMTRALDRFPGASMHNLYGPTEASIDVTAWRCMKNPRGIVPIGRPIANSEIYILDEQKTPVAIGAVGELYIGGVGLARGYHARPELTAERFVPHPFSAVPGARLYRTGDLARFDEEGCIEYVGRNDDQIKLRGFRVELGEIENVLRDHPEVQGGAVIARRTPAATMLEAFVVAKRDTFDVGELRAWLRSKLPEYMVPSRIVPIERLPLSHNGKVDRRALHDLAPHPMPQTHVAPRTPVERVLAEVFQDVLRVRAVSIHDNYFALGGDSIRSLQVRAMARARGLELEVTSLLTHQTVAELATLVGTDGTETETERAPDETPAAFALIRSSERATLEAYEDAYPATRLQLGMLYHSEMTRDSWAYHDVISMRIELGTGWQEPAMDGALASVIARHPVLRSSFDAGSYARPLQLIHRAIKSPLIVRDLRGIEAAAAREILREYIEEDKTRGYDFADAPLFRVAVHVLGAQAVQLTLSFHHAILDGWSAATFLRELLTGYLSATGVQGLPVFEAPLHSFSAFVALETRARDSDVSRAYFAKSLEEMQLTALPRWPEAERASSPGAAREIIELDAALTGQLRELSARKRAPLKALLMAAHVRALAAFTGSLDVVTGWVVHGRPEVAGAERILGLFLNTLPVRFTFKGTMTWADLIAQVVRTEQDLHPHRHFPLHDIQRLLDRSTLFETAFNYVHFHQYEELLAGGSLRVLDFEAHENTGFATMVNFVLHPGTGQLALHVQYDSQKVAFAQAQQIARGHVLALEHMVRDPESPVSRANLVGPAERAELEAWSRGAPAADALPLHVSFEGQVDRTPDRAAVQHDAQVLSYRELDEWANHVARELLEAGTRPGEVIAVCAEPSLQRAAAVLGVLKAGCTCLPLDVDYPDERILYMLERVGARRTLATPRYGVASFLQQQQVLLVDQPGSAQRGIVRVSAHDPAYIIFTSGSTGRPKGILMPHVPLANLVAWHVAQSELEPGSATAQFSLFGFDVSLQEMFSTWASGGKLVMVPESARKDARQLAKLLSQECVARLFVPVVALHQLAEVADQLQLALPELREIISAGEQLEITSAVRAFVERHPRCRLQNHYGPTETHVATAYLLPDGVATWPVTTPVGRPLPGVRAYVLDATRQPAPVGVPGEIFLAGPCVGLGYCNDEALTAERFTRDPYDSASGDRMYETGDLVRWLPGGNLEYCGRRDAQLKIRGYRVELGEIESALVAVSEGRVQRAAVVAVPGRMKTNSHELVAYVVPDSGAPIDAAQLRAALARRVPAHMVPSVLHVLSALPTAPSGKIDRRELSSLAQRTPLQAPSRVAPETPLETELCGLWHEVLAGRDHDLGVTDDFFASGGDSLSAVRLMARIQRRYGIELPIATLIEAPTVRELARVLEAAGPAARTPTLVRLGGAGTRPPVFCMHPIGGHVLCYAALARHLGEDQPCFGIRARGLTEAERPHTSVVEMATAYAGEILSAQPHGTVHVTGWSFGGTLALEVARQLRRAGRSVAPVVIIDTTARVTSTVQLSEDDFFEVVVMELFGMEIDGSAIEAVLQRSRKLDRTARLESIAALMRERRIVPDAASLPQLEHVITVIQRNVQAIYDYEPRLYDGPVVLLRCSAKLPESLQRLYDRVGTTYGDPTNGWAELCPQLEVVPVEGDHVSIVFEPHVAAVARVLRRVVTDGAVSRPASEFPEQKVSPR